MSFTTNTKVTWQDLVDLYSNLNDGRQKFGFNTVTLTEDKLTKASQVGTVNALVNEMASNKYLTSVAKTNITVPTIASLLQASFTFAISTTVNNIKNTCAHDAANFTSDRSYNGTNFTTNRSDFGAFFTASNRSNFTSNKSFDGDFSGNRSFTCSNFSGNRSFCPNFTEGSFGDFPSRESNSSF